MSSLSITDRHNLEKMFDMSSGYVLNFSDRSFGDFVHEVVGLDIHGEDFRSGGKSKANKLRTLWKHESDYVVGKLIMAMIDYDIAQGVTQDPMKLALTERCRQIGARLLAGGPSLTPLKEQANPRVPQEAQEEALRKVLRPETPSLTGSSDLASLLTRAGWG